MDKTISMLLILTVVRFFSLLNSLSYVCMLFRKLVSSAALSSSGRLYSRVCPRLFAFLCVNVVESTFQLKPFCMWKKAECISRSPIDCRFGFDCLTPRSAFFPLCVCFPPRVSETELRIIGMNSTHTNATQHHATFNLSLLWSYYNRALVHQMYKCIRCKFGFVTIASTVFRVSINQHRHLHQSIKTISTTGTTWKSILQMGFW